MHACAPPARTTHLVHHSRVGRTATDRRRRARRVPCRQRRDGAAGFCADFVRWSARRRRRPPQMPPAITYNHPFRWDAPNQWCTRRGQTSAKINTGPFLAAPSLIAETMRARRLGASRAHRLNRLGRVGQRACRRRVLRAVSHVEGRCETTRSFRFLCFASKVRRALGAATHESADLRRPLGRRARRLDATSRHTGRSNLGRAELGA